jgi:hypothetical protein
MRKVETVAALLAVTAALACADAGDPPSRVARLNYQNGGVSFRPGSVEEWTGATLNYPLTNGDHLWTEAGARSEMHVGSTAIRMDGRTALAILSLDDRTVQLSLTEGSIHVRLRNLAEDEVFEVDTPNAAISLLRPGEYRIDADADAAVTLVSVASGEAEVTGGNGGTFPVRSSQSARIAGVDQPTQELSAAVAPNEFERWAEDRDRHEDRSQSVRYVSRETIGYEDLDDYGVWRDEPDYGWVWAPRTVSAGWAPYRNGRWAWVEPWGWTWVDEAPWGFAPFHYGRWAYTRVGWVWVPGRSVARPVYAPALVAFVGGPGFGMSVAIGGGGPVGWFPLGPREIYRPAYHVSDVYVRQVNVTHVNVTNVNVTNVTYVNQRVNGAVTAVSRETFVSARPVYRSTVAVSAREMERAQVVGAAPYAPRRESVLVGGSISAPPVRYAERAVVVRRAPPPAPVSFRAKEQALDANQGRPLDSNTMNTLRGNAPVRYPMVRTVAPSQPGAPMRRMAPQQQQQQQQQQQNAPPNWRQENARPQQQMPPRSERPPRMEQQQQQNAAPPAPPQQQQPRTFGDRPRQEQRNAEPPRNPEAPRRVEAPRNEPPPRRAEPQRTEQPNREARPQDRKVDRGERKSDRKEEKKQ